MLELNKIYQGDCLEVLKTLPAESMDIVITSPPYNVDLGNNKYHKNPYDLYNDNKEHKDYISWLEKIFTDVYRILIKSGRVCINIGDGKNGAITTHSDIINFMIKIGYIPLTTIIWDKNQIGSRTAWGSFQSPSCPSFPTQFEYILVFCKESKKLLTKGETDLTKQEFINWSMALWKFAPETNQKNIGHNAMFPIELPKRLLKMFSWVNSIVYDPFMGAGTTAIACKILNRNYIGSEISPQYCKIAEERIKNTQTSLI